MHSTTLSAPPDVSDNEDVASDDTLSIVGGALVDEKASAFSVDFESVGGDVHHQRLSWIRHRWV